MSVLSDELDAVIADLGGVGVPATISPAGVWTLAAQSPVAALVDRPDSLRVVNLAAGLTFDAVVLLVAYGPDHESGPRLLEALPDVLNVLRPTEAVSPDRLRNGTASMLAYRILSPRLIAL